MGKRVIIILFVMFFVCSTSRAQTPGSVRAHIDSAFNFMQRHAVFAPAIKWKTAGVEPAIEVPGGDDFAEREKDKKDRGCNTVVQKTKDVSIEHSENKKPFEKFVGFFIL
jgi:hypothetical protein